MRSQIKQCFLVVLILTSLATAALQWELKDDLNIARHQLTGGSLNGYVYAIGGVVAPSSPGDAQNTVSKYDPSANTWTLDIPMPTARHSLSSAVVGNHIYAIGGHVANSRSENERFNGSTWESRAGIYARSSLGVAAYNGEIYAFGGNHYANIQSRFDIYNLLTDTWRYGGEMPAVVEPHRALTCNDKIYIPAITTDNPYSGKLWVLDPLTNSWDLSSVPIPNVPRANYELQCVDGRIYTIGGQTASGAVATVESWALGETDWRFEPSLNVERSVFASAIIGMDIYVFGGVNSSGDLASTEVLHIPEPATLLLLGLGGLALRRIYRRGR